PGSGPVAFGLFTFDGDAVGSTLVVPRIVLARRDGLAWLTTIDEAGRETDVLDFPPAEPPARQLSDLGRIRYGDGTLTAPEWEHAVERAIKKIRDGALDKVVLA